MRKNRVLTGILAALIVATSLPISASANATASAGSTTNVNADANLKLNYHSLGVQVGSITESLASKSKGNYAAATASTLPSKYPALESGRLPNLPTIRNQNPYGTCWAFASTACAEISILMQENVAYDFSELALAYFTYQGTTDPLGGTEGDTNAIGTNETDHFLDIGGNLVFSMQAYAAWKGATAEEVAPYPGYDETMQLIF